MQCVVFQGPVEMPAANLVPTACGDWAIPAAELAKYAQIFSGMQPVNGKLSGDKVKPEEKFCRASKPVFVSVIYRKPAI